MSFVSTASSLRTFNALTMTQVGEFDWTGGGLSGPAIGPTGRVYALPANTLLRLAGSPTRAPCIICTLPPIQLGRAL